MYGLPKAGQLVYIALINHLQLHGYTHSGFTPGIFKHATLDTILSLVVDDFGVKYTARNYALHLIDTLNKNTPESLLILVAEFSLVFTYIGTTSNSLSIFPCLTTSTKPCKYFNIKNLNITNTHHIHMKHQTMEPRSSMHLPLTLPILQSHKLSTSKRSSAPYYYMTVPSTPPC